MAGEASSSLPLFSNPFLLFFFSILAFFFLIIHHLRKKLLCRCEICQTYIKSNWSENFPNLCDWYAHLLRSSPTKTVCIHVLGNIITANPENVEYVLKTRFENYPKGKRFSAILQDFLGRGIFNVDGDSWRFQRKMVALVLGSRSIRSYGFEIINSEVNNRLIPLLSAVAREDDRILDLQEVLRRFSFDSICRFSFGLDPMCLELSLPMSEFAIAFDLASRLSAERAMLVSPLIWKVKKLLNFGSERKLKQSLRLINILAKEVINKKRRTEVSNQKDLLSRFMQTVSDEGYLRDIIVSFLLAGRDTVSSALTSFFWILTKNPDVGRKIQEEADKILGESKDPKSFEELGELHYLNASMHETMRLYPPVQFDSKFCEDDDVLPDGTFVRRGTRVTYHPYAMGRIGEIWGPDCLEFKPERWLKGGVFFPENPYKYPVFQAGFRVCLGKEMALVEIKIVALSLIRKFHFSLATSGDSPRFSPGLTATFSGGLPMFVKEKNHNKLNDPMSL